jgi:ATP-dependent Clp protease ATP-binding subunit ClpA
MDFEKYTDRARGFVQSAQSLALREGHQQFTPEHLLKVLLDDPEGLAAGLIDIQMLQLRKLLEDRKITVELEPAAREWLAEKGYDPAYGARPLKRVIQKTVQDPLAELILSSGIKDGERVTISAGKQGPTFRGQIAAAA